MTGQEILALPMERNDAGAATIKEYLIALLEKLWADGESFGGKRPFGNSGWEFELYKPLIVGGAVAGKLDSDGYIEDLDNEAAADLIFSAIAAL
jgi:hypothetical protein